MECTLQNISFFSHHTPGPDPVDRKDTDGDGDGDALGSSAACLGIRVIQAMKCVN